MQKLILAAPLAVALVAATVTPSPAVVNCDTVNRELKLGRWPEDVAESMGVTLADVKNCRDKAGGTTTGNATPARASSATSRTPAVTKKQGK